MSEHDFPKHFSFRKQIILFSPPKEERRTSYSSSEDESSEQAKDDIDIASTKPAVTTPMPLNLNFGVNSYVKAAAEPKIKPIKRSKSTSDVKNIDYCQFLDDLKESLPE